MKEIPLTKGYKAIVDDEDFERLSGWKWHAMNAARTRVYAATSRIKNGVRVHMTMHRMLMAPLLAAGMEVDHINGDGLDNRRCNLRICTRAENARNNRTPCTNRSGFKGVSFYKRRGVWRSHITVNGKFHHLGYFSTAENAHAAYCEAAKRLHGEFARVS